MHPITAGISRRAIIDLARPTRETRRIRFSTEEIDVMLSHEEIRGIDWIRSVDDFIVGDCHSSCERCAQRSAGHFVQADGEGLVAFGIRVINDWYGERLGSLTRGELQSTYDICVVTTRRRRAIEYIAVLQACCI